MKAPGISLVCFLLIAGCAPTNGRIGLRPPANSAQAPAADHCTSRLNRTRAGGTVGSVIGFIAASALGSPLLGILYQVGGYAAGFASADPCRKQNETAITTAAARTTDASAAALTGKISEEDLK